MLFYKAVQVIFFVQVYKIKGINVMKICSDCVCLLRRNMAFLYVQSLSEQ